MPHAAYASHLFCCSFLLFRFMIYAKSHFFELKEIFPFFFKLASRRNPPNSAIWLVPRAGGFSRSCPLTRPESLAASFRVDQGGGGGVVVYQYTRKKFAKIPENTQNSSKYTQNYTQVYFIPEIQRKWYTEYPYLSCNIPYTRFKKPLYNPGRPCSFTSLICLLFVKEQNPWFVNHFSFKTCAVISIS